LETPSPSPRTKKCGSACWDTSSAAVRPTPFDRILATRFGVAAVDLNCRRRIRGKWCVLRNERIEAVDIAQAIGKLKTVDPAGQLVQMAKAIGISFGRLSPQGVNLDQSVP